MTLIRVLLVDDSRLFLASTARVLATDPHVNIVASVESGQEALAQVEQLDCDLVLLDLAMPHMNGLEVARRLRERPKPPRIVLLSLNDTPEYRAAAEMHTDGFLDKSLAATHLVPLIRSLFPTAQAG